jgi:hypothetical protein
MAQIVNPQGDEVRLSRNRKVGVVAKTTKPRWQSARISTTQGESKNVSINYHRLG